MIALTNPAGICVACGDAAPDGDHLCAAHRTATRREAVPIVTGVPRCRVCKRIRRYVRGRDDGLCSCCRRHLRFAARHPDKVAAPRPRGVKRKSWRPIAIREEGSVRG